MKLPPLLVLAGLLLACFPGRAVERPNILWITAEDLSPNLGCYGDTFARTPNLDAFARQAVRYTRAFATAPVCAPSRASLIVGVESTILGNPHLRCELTLPSSFHGYPVFLRAAGYHTSNNVKTDYNLRDEAEFVRRWWDRSDAQAHWRQRAAGQPFFAVFNLMETHQSRTSAWSEEEFERSIGRSLSPDQRADPARVPLPPFYPDTPGTRRALARYYDCITAMDRRVGDVLRELEADGLVEDTIVFYYSDHGMGMPRGKRLLHDSGMRVPMMIRFPRRWQHLAPATPGATVDRLVTFVDLPPTLLSLIGASIPEHLRGTPFLGPAAGAPRRAVYGARDRVDEAYDTSRSVRESRWLYIRNFRPHLSWAAPESFSDTSTFRRELLALARAGRAGTGPTAWLAPTRPREELYDTVADPYQLSNLASDSAHAATLGRLRADLRTRLIESRDLAFLPEFDVLARSAGKPPYEMARQPGAYPVAEVIAAAELVGDVSQVERQRELLRHADSGVRYWAAVGFTANATGATRAIADLERALADPSPPVQIEAATALLATAAAPRGLAALARFLDHTDLNLALSAARALELSGERARPLLPALRTRLELARSRLRTSEMERYVAFSLGALVPALE